MTIAVEDADIQQRSPRCDPHKCGPGVCIARGRRGHVGAMPIRVVHAIFPSEVNAYDYAWTVGSGAKLRVCEINA